MHTKLQLNKQTVRYVPCIGVKIPSQVDSDRAKTSKKERAIKGMSQNRGCTPREAMTDTKG